MSNYYSKSYLKTSDRQEIKQRYINIIARSIVTIGLVASGNLLALAPLLAAPAAANIQIENQATGAFTDDTDPTGSQSIVSNIVSVTVVEVAGIAITPASTPTAVTGSVANFDFKIQNAGNDPTKFFLPTAPSSFSGGTLGVLQVIAYIDATGARFELAVPIDLTASKDTSQLSDPTLGGKIVAGSIPPDAAIIVRVPVTVTALGTFPVSVILGDPHGGTPPTSTPYVLGNNNVYTVDNPSGAGVSGEADGMPFNGDAVLHRQEASGKQTVIANTPPPVTISGTVFSDADANVAINGTDAGTNAGSLTLTVYAIDTSNGNIVDKATVGANGIYTLSNVPALSSIQLRISNDSRSLIGNLAPAAPSLPTGWFQTGKNLNGTIDPTIATLGDITVSTTTANLAQQNFGIRETYTLAASAAVTCTANFTNLLNTGVSASGTQLPDGANDLNWTAEWLPGPTTTGGVGDPYSRPRPVGVMPAVVTGNLAIGAWITEPGNAKWISYPFRLSTNDDGNHSDADLDGASENNGSGTNTSDTVRLKFTSKVTLPSNANTIAISLPAGVSVDNQFVSLKVNGVENLVPTPTQDPQALSFRSLQIVNIKDGWQPGVNTIEVILDSGPPLTGFFLGVRATTTQICGKPNMLLVKRITAINNVAQKRSGAPLNAYEDDTTNPYDDNNNAAPTVAYPQRSTNKWPTPGTFLLGSVDGGTIAPNDSIEYTIYYLSAGDAPAKKVLMCDRVPDKITFNPSAYNSIPAGTGSLPGADRGIVVNKSGTVKSYSNAGDDDFAQYFPPGTDPATVFPKIDCGGPNTNGAVVVNFGDIPQATASGTPDSYGFIRFQGRVK
jgi:uncharacterized repeat protein (TIGR01451 family)